MADTKRYIEKLANEVIREHDMTGNSLTECAYNVAVLNALSENNIENLCKRVNHIKFAEEHTKDPMVNFSIANVNDVKTMLNPVEKVANIREVAAEIDIVDIPMEKAASSEEEDKYQNESHNNWRVRQFSMYKLAAEQVMDELQKLEITRDDLVFNIYKIVEGLINSGSSVKDIYATLSKTWPDIENDTIKAILDNAVLVLQSEGRIPEDIELLDEPGEAIPEELDERNPLVEPAQKLASLNEDIVRNSLAYFNVLEGLYKHAEENFVYQPRHEIPYRALIYGDNHKTVSENLEKISRHVPLTPPFHGVGGGTSVMGNLGRVAGGAAMLAGALKLVEQGIKGARGLKHNVQKPRAKAKLLREYPNLREIPEREFDQIFESVVNLDPHLMRAPYALYNIIMRVHTYGAMDTGLIMQLQGAGGPQQEKLISGIPSNLLLGNNQMIP